MKHTRHLMAAGLLACSLSAVTATTLADECGGPPFGWSMGYDAYGYGMGYGERFGRMPYAMFGNGRFEGGGYYAYLADRLELSAEQRNSVREIIAQAREAARKLRDAMLDTRERMRDTLEDKGYGAQFEQLAGKQGDLIGRMIALDAKTRSEVRGVLTDDQKKELKDLRTRRHHRDDDGWWYY